MTVQYDNLAGTILYKEDGNLAPEATATAPRVCIIGTAGQGQGSLPYLVSTTGQARAEFGSEGNLIRGMWEAKKAGAKELYLYRIGAQPAVVAGIGNAAGTSGAGITVTTIEEDASAGVDYAMYYDDSEGRLVVIRNSDSTVVYDNLEANPVDRYEVTVSGYPDAAGGPDIGSASNFVNLKDVTGTGTSYTAGTDGLDLCRMKMYEKLYVAYEHLKEYNFDVVVPMDVYLDDYNTVDQGHYLGAVPPKSNSGADDTYPTMGKYIPGSDIDSLGMVYTEEYEGTQYFWWRFATSGATANIYTAAGVGSASLSAKIDGTALTADDFHEVNFAYQLGRFLYEYSTNIVDATGVIGVLPPASANITDRARWLGKAPTWTYNPTTGEYYIASSDNDGTGLLGNKFMVGKASHRSGIFGGGFIATDGKFMDSGDEIVDSNDIPVDLGKYFSVVADYPLLRNNFNSLGYVASFAASYAGFYSNMNPASAPTNKKVSNAQIIYRQNLESLNSLAGNGYTVLRNKPQGLVVALAPTASMPNSDWKKLSTVRIVKTVVDGIRDAVDSFLGEALTQGKKGALQQAIEKVLLNAKKIGILRDYRPFEIIQTADMAVAGRADVNLTLIPAFELTQIVLTISLAKS